MTDRTSIFVTGATGFVGARVVRRLLADRRVARVHVLARDPWRLHGLVHEHGLERVVPVEGDLSFEGLGIDAEERARLAREVTGVVHLAADTSFSQPLHAARAVNRDGTARLLELSAGWTGVTRWLYVSTAFVAGQRTGVIAEDDAPTHAWVNAYEQSKAEAERLVRAARPDWVIARPSTIVCDDLAGGIGQLNAVHRALRLYFGGLAAMLPGADASTLDVVTAEYVADAVARLALAPGEAGRTFHLCAGTGAMPLDELLDRTHAVFLRSPAWRRRGIARPVRTNLPTYRVFERAVEDGGSERVKHAVRALGHFVPQLAYPKRFDTSGADALLGAPAPAVREFWTRMVGTLVGVAPAARPSVSSASVRELV
jgi:nucleoside-diphosphate-sugar epimerase